MMRFVYIFGLSFLLFQSCQDVVDVDLDEKDLNLVVLEGNITTEDDVVVRLTRSVKVSEEAKYPAISDAQVMVYDDAQPRNEILLVESLDEDGLYEVPENDSYMGIAGRTYTVEVTIGSVVITGSDMINQATVIDSIQIKPSQFGSEQFFGVFVFSQEPEGIGDFYRWDIYVNGERYVDPDFFPLVSDEFVDGNYVEGFEIMTDFHDVNDPVDRVLNMGDTIFVKQIDLSSEAYDYYFLLLTQGQSNSGGNFFAVPPANLKSNLVSSDGKRVLGIFTATGSSTSNDIVLTQEDEDLLNKEFVR